MSAINEINNVTNSNFTYATIPTPIDPTGSVVDFAGLSILVPSPGDVYITLDTGISWMCNGYAEGTATWVSVNEYIYLSYPAGGAQGLRTPGVIGFSGISGSYGYDGIEQYNIDGFYSSGFFNISPPITAMFSSSILFPTDGVPYGNGALTMRLPVPTAYNQTFIAKLTKSAFYDDLYHERQFKWYCTGVSGPYHHPEISLM